MAAALLTSVSWADGARNYLSIVGSSSLMPFSEAVSDRIAKSGKIKRPKLESTGTGGGFTLFCDGVGMDFPDIVNAGRRIESKEFESCRNHGVTGIVEVKVGHDGVVLASAQKDKPLGELSRKELYLALAKQVPDPACKGKCEKLVPNPYKTWRQINPAWPDSAILIYGPTASAGLRDTLSEIVMELGCVEHPWIAKQARNDAEHRRLCRSIREDGMYVEETDERRVAGVSASPDALGLFGYGWLKRHADQLRPVAIEGIVPSDDSIADQRYPISRAMYFYVKKAHVERVPGITQYIAEFTGDKAWGQKGYLVPLGLIPMSQEERAAYAADAKHLKDMAAESFAATARRPPETNRL
jgi:phosphate transport system substrate-binding protein